MKIGGAIMWFIAVILVLPFAVIIKLAKDSK